ncbi:protein unc-50 homolog [Uranotaenia lowii]|uniref:protein unc-50 homolog n=1 Tax=Uranotaenia lowii TaxID=190385 RepID=UPI00247A7B8D|nr:protein unc-50 homolog [Uranotaenia lowii]
MKYSTSPTPSRSNSSLLGMASSSSRTTSPLPPPANFRSSDCLSATSKSYKYLRRFVKFDQMDFEFAMWQMLYLFIAPKKVYRNVNYRKQTKSQFARDDPAFLVLLVAALCVTSIGFAWVLRLGIGQSILFLLYVVFVDCIFCGMIVATLLWFVANRYLRESTADMDVEWGYAFDVHLNAFFPPLILLHFIQLFFYQALISHEWFVSTFIGNTIWLAALSYYIYITFLGYNVVPNLRNTRIFLVMLPVLFLFYVVTLIIGWNLSVSLMYFYHYRVL